MKKILFCFIYLYLLSANLFAASPDSLVYFDDLDFLEENELKAFKNLNQPKNDFEFMNLMMAFYNQKENNSFKDCESKLTNFTEGLSKKIKDKEEAEKIKFLTKKIQKTFLKVYKFNSSFSSTIVSGTYNNITTMALYSLVLSKLEIPYQIKEVSNHIYIIAFPSTSKILIESKVAEKKIFEFSEHYISQYNKALYSYNLILKEEFEKTNSQQLFEKHYFASSTISLIQLASVQYSTFSVFLSAEKKNQEAIENAEKAYYLNPIERNKLNLTYHILSNLGSNNYNDKKDVEKLVFLCRLHNIKDVQVNDEFIKSEYLRLLNTQIVQNLDYKICEQYHTLLIKNIRDTLLLKALEFHYHSYLARAVLNNSLDKASVLNHLQLAYKIKPDDVELQTLIIECLSVILRDSTEAEKALLLLDEYGLKFNFVNSISSALKIRANCYLDIAYNNFLRGFSKEGVEYLDKFDQLGKSYSIMPDAEFVERGYMSAARYFYNAGNRIKAKEYLAKGLELAPSSTLIQDKLKMLK